MYSKNVKWWNVDVLITASVWILPINWDKTHSMCSGILSWTKRRRGWAEKGQSRNTTTAKVVPSVADPWHYWCESGSRSGSRSGSADPCLWLMDPDPSIFISGLQDANKKLILFGKVFLYITFWRYFYIIFQRYKVKKITKRSKSRFFLRFLLTDRRIRSRNRINTSD